MLQTLARAAALAFVFAAVFSPAALAQGGHEYAPLVERKLDYKDWTFKSLKDGSPVNLRELLKGKKLVMVVYFAPWCGNWKYEAPLVSRLYNDYKQHGFDVVGVSEYASADDTRKYFEASGGAPYTVVVESEGREARDQTTHYAYRQASEDARRWGSPFNVFLEPARLNAKGDVLAERAWVVGGELIEQDAEKFIRGKLGLAEKGDAGKLLLKDQAGAEPCQDRPAAALTAKP